MPAHDDRPSPQLPAIDPDVSAAQTLPGRFYGDPAMFALQRDRVFARSWQLVGDAGQLAAGEPAGAGGAGAAAGGAGAAPGSAPPSAPAADRQGFAHPFTLLEGCLDEPLLLTRDRDSALHCLSNVCTHRGNLVVNEPSAARALRCRYHGRRFELDGRHLASPHFEGAQRFPSPTDDLPRVPLGQWGPLLFASLDPAVAFEAWSEPLRTWMSVLPPQQLSFDPTTSRDYEVRANWALYCDNYMEGFHIPFVHPELAAALDWRGYRTELLPLGTLQIGVAAADEPAFDLPAAHPHRGQSIAAYYLWLFPNLMLNLYPWGLSINVVRPLAVDRTRISFRSYVADPTRRGQGAGGDLHQVELQDETVVESVQRGVRSRLYHRGRYAPSQEAGVHHFHRLLLAAMGSEPSPRKE
jgi:choline monooxygenase